MDIKINNKKRFKYSDDRIFSFNFDPYYKIYDGLERQIYIKNLRTDCSSKTTYINNLHKTKSFYKPNSYEY